MLSGFELYSRWVPLISVLYHFLYAIFDVGHALDDENGNTPHTPFSDELLALTQTLQKLTGLANNPTAEYKEKFNLLF